MQLEMSSRDFEYEIQALIKAFYPNEDETIKIRIILEQDTIGISFFQNGIPILEKTGFVREETKRGYKNVLKRYLYEVLKQVSNLTLPWGTLTGVRPTKLAMELLEEGYQREDAKAYMIKQYYCTEEKAELGLDIASKELSLLEEIDYKNGYSLYIGIPFCPTTCAYCSFTSYSLKQWGSYVESYLEALFQEIEYAKTAMPNKKLNTIYIGGGTPTTLEAKQLKRLIDKIKENFSMEYVKEFTVEAGRPDSITKEKLKVLKENGVTRISINPQTMNQKTLDEIGRKHTVAQVEEAFRMARELEHNNINMDLIVGLSEETCEDVKYTLECIRKLNPDSITIHSLVLKRAANLNTQKEKYQKREMYQKLEQVILKESVKKENALEDIQIEENANLEHISNGYNEERNVDKMLHIGEIFAKEEGYIPYYLYRQKNATGSGNMSRENVGYARKGKEGIYNILIMEEKQSILALGAGAASKFVFEKGGRIERIENVKSVKDYVERIDEMIQRKRAFLERESL